LPAVWALALAYLKTLVDAHSAVKHFALRAAATLDHIKLHELQTYRADDQAVLVLRVRFFAADFFAEVGWLGSLGNQYFKAHIFKFN
jgi:hypothetical protein